MSEASEIKRNNTEMFQFRMKYQNYLQDYVLGDDYTNNENRLMIIHNTK